MPLQRIDLTEKGGVRSKRGQFLEEQRKIAAFAEDFSRKALKLAVSVEQRRCTLRSDAGDARVAIRAVSDKCKIIGDQPGRDAKFRHDAVGIADSAGFSIECLDDAVAAHALREILVGCPDEDP